MPVTINPGSLSASSLADFYMTGLVDAMILLILCARVRLSTSSLFLTLYLRLGALAFPSAFASMGLIPGILSCAFSASTSIFGLYLLSRCATMVGKKPGQETTKASFNEVAKMTFGKGWATRVFDVSYFLLDEILS